MVEVTGRVLNGEEVVADNLTIRLNEKPNDCGRAVSNYLVVTSFPMTMREITGWN